MPLQQSTPPSYRHRWQGTRTAFVDLVSSLTGCMQTIGLTGITLNVEIGDHEGKLGSTQELRDELTEARWLAARRIRVHLWPTGSLDAGLSLILEPAPPVLFVAYHGEKLQMRETLRAVVDRTLPPERPDLRRRWRWVGPIFGCAVLATAWLIGTRLTLSGIYLRASHTVRYTIIASDFVLGVGIFTYWTWWAFRFWFPPLERLPDSSKSRWDRARGWVKFAVPLWVAVVLALLALPAAH